MRAVPATEVPKGTQILDYVWRVTYKKNRGNGKPPARAHFCIAGNRDWNKESNVPTSPVTPQRAIRTRIAAAATLGFTLHTEDVLRAYLQSDELPEPVYVRIPPEAGEPFPFVWALFRTIYGKDDAGRHFHFFLQKRFPNIPNVTFCMAFETIYIWALHGAKVAYVDDTLFVGDKLFDAAICTVMEQYKTHRPDHGTIQFASISATTDDYGVHCNGGLYASSVVPITEPERMNDPWPDPRALSALAAKQLWVGRCRRPDVLTNATRLANLVAPTGADAHHANDALALLTKELLSLQYPKLDRASLRIVVYADYSGSALSN
eukprot:contig_21075_g5178